MCPCRLYLKSEMCMSGVTNYISPEGQNFKATLGPESQIKLHKNHTMLGITDGCLRVSCWFPVALVVFSLILPILEFSRGLVSSRLDGSPVDHHLCMLFVSIHLMWWLWSGAITSLCFFFVSTPLATALLYKNDQNKARFAGLHCLVSALRKHLFVLAIVKEQL